MENKEKPDEQSLLVEYQVLNDSVNRRYSDMLMVNSVMIPTSLAIVTFAFIYRKDLGRSAFIGLPISGFIPIVSLILVSFVYFLWWTTTKINDISFERQREIEKELHIKGHSYIREQTRCKTWFKVRWLMWHFIFLLIMGACIYTSVWLFFGY